MAQAYAKISFTEDVLSIQEKQGSDKLYEWMLSDDAEPGDKVGPKEAAFIESMNGFYQATVNADGWPYVQFRGGPKGFLKVLDEKRVAYADYRGNRQYLSLGNIQKNSKISIMLMDYAQRRRLKILGHASIVEIEEDRDLLQKIMPQNYRAMPERAVVINIDALDWNCPAHIPVRLTLEELEPQLYTLREELVNLRAENAELRSLLQQSLKS